MKKNQSMKRFPWELGQRHEFKMCLEKENLNSWNMYSLIPRINSRDLNKLSMCQEQQLLTHKSSQMQ